MTSSAEKEELKKLIEEQKRDMRYSFAAYHHLPGWFDPAWEDRKHEPPNSPPPGWAKP